MIEDLRKYITIVNNKSLTKSAEILHVTQPALSQTIQRLEKEIHAHLFLRNGKQFSITTDGASLYVIALKIVDLWEKVKNPQTRICAEKTITIGLFDNAAVQLAGFFQKQFKKKEIIEIKIDHSLQLLQDLHFGIIDICICVLHARTSIPKNGEIVAKFSEELIPVSSTRMNAADIENIPFIMYKKGSETRNSIDDTFFRNGIQPTIIAESTSTTFMKELAMHGGGVTLLPKNFVINEIKNKKLFLNILPFTFYRTIGILIQKDGTLSKNNVLLQQIATYIQ